jgi:hypothetical protein
MLFESNLEKSPDIVNKMLLIKVQLELSEKVIAFAVIR